MNISSVLDEFITTFHIYYTKFSLITNNFEINDFHLKISPTIRIGYLDRLPRATL